MHRVKKCAYLAAVMCALLSSCSGSTSGGTVASPSAPGVSLTAPALSPGGPSPIYGTATYEKLEWNSSGLTGRLISPAPPIRYARVELVQNGAAVATATSDSTGYYSFPSVSVTGGVYVRILSDAVSPYSATVVDNASATYALRSSDFTFASGQSWKVNLLASHSDAGNVFNIFDCLIRAQDVDHLLSGSYPSRVTGVWYQGNSGTDYTNGSNTISVYGASTVAAGGNDAYDDAVVMHETGHYAASNYSRDNSPGGAHYINMHYDLRLTWSEGWATFFSAMSRSLRPITGADYPKWYVDTPGWLNADGTPLSGTVFAFEIDSPSYSSQATGADNELAVSTVLWHVYASTGSSLTSPYLGLSDGSIWSTFATYLPGMTSAIYATLDRFYDGWNAGHPGQMASILSDRTIRYVADAYGTHSSTGTALTTLTPGTTQTVHNFFPAGAKHYYAISVGSGSQYTFATSSLGDGADTMLTLFDSDGKTMLAQNDDYEADNDAVTPDNTYTDGDNDLASKIVWVANGTKTVYLLCEPYRPYVSSDIYLYTGATGKGVAKAEYGSYTISAGSP
ncbi:MAG: hypothetical protein HY280_00540 [Nitrospinae bacterium]|nr:hypothetical protein [Nitrospinota bacterium]